VGFQFGPSKKDLYIAFDGTENLQKRAAERTELRTAFKSWAREGQDTSGLQGIGSSYRLSRRMRERDQVLSSAVKPVTREKNSVFMNTELTGTPFQPGSS